MSTKVWLDEKQRATCPRCQSLIVTIMCQDDNWKLEADDVIVCEKCGTMLRVNEELYLEKPTQEWIDRLERNYPYIVKNLRDLQKQIHERRAKELTVN